MTTALPAVTMDVTVTAAMGSAGAQVALRGHAVVHSAGRTHADTQRGRETETDTRAQRQRVCIQSMALPNLERLVLRSPTFALAPRRPRLCAARRNACYVG